jgi:lipopolysaccharide/colanic/teichoic acid biosynthesis glycosyltransferase
VSKRIFDFLSACLGLLLLAPFLIIIAIIIRHWDGSQILFRQARVGRNGQDFILNKFRTMTIFQDGAKGSFDLGNKDRVTRIGAFLRKTKLDELPQLWNVLWGDMSLVGPRPEVRKWVDAYPERWAKVLAVRPGITDPASIYYRNEEGLLAKADDPEAFYRDHILPHKLDLYEEYLTSQSFSGDISLIYKTILSVFSPRLYTCKQNLLSSNKTGNPSSQ